MNEDIGDVDKGNVWVASNGTICENDNGDELDTNDERPVDRERQCGVGNWRPSCLQPCANIKVFTAVLSFWSLFGSMNFTYYTAVIYQIEKQFGLSSSMSGFIKNVDNIGYMICVVLFSHFCRYTNKPRLFAVATLVSSSAIFLFSTPYFIYGSGDVDASSVFNVSVNSTTVRETEFCDGQHEDEQSKFCAGVGAMRTFNAGAVAIFIVSELIQGIGQSPKFTLSMTYMDDNAKDSSPKYFSFMFAMRAFSPVVGFMLGAWTTSLYVDLSDPGIDQKDPRWVGAWWLGFIICSVCSVIWALPMVLFPNELSIDGTDDDALKAKRKREEGQFDFKNKSKDLPKALYRLASNPIYMLVLIAICCEVYIMGYFTFLNKYLEQQFGLTASMASIITGTVGAVGLALGPLVSGRIMTLRKKFTPFYAMSIIMVTTVISAVCYFAMIFVGCPPSKWAGNIAHDSLNLSLPCNGNCSCDTTNFQPLCGADGTNYYSPCHAGCADQIIANGTTIYTGCQCIPTGIATRGVCNRECSMFIPYAILLFLTKFVGTMDSIPTMTIFMKCVESRDKALSLAMASFVIVILMFPAPILFGLVVDSACLVLQGGSCSSRKGACLLYDSETFRIRLHVFTFGVKFAALFFYVGALYLSRTSQYYEENDEEKKDELEPMNEVKEKEIIIDSSTTL